MAISDLFSKRQKRQRGEIPEIYVYDEIPQPLRVQIFHIVRDAFGTDKRKYNGHDKPAAAYKYIHETLCREYGLFSLVKGYEENDARSVFTYFLETKEIEKALDIVELCFRYIEAIRGNYTDYTYYTKIKIEPNEAISELNDRFKEHGVGYQFESGKIIRIDSTFIHSEITKPTLSLLLSKKLQGANEEYLKAHEHYRNGRNKECLTECLKAFESSMKIICNEKGWAYNQSDTSKKLIKICLQNGLVPSFTQSQFTSLSSLLESGIPTIRNRLGGHGQGQIPQKVDDEVTRYGLNLTGSNIIFLVEQSGIK